MTIVDALKALVTAIGGTYAASDDTVSEILEKVTAAFESGEFVTDLPTVTDSDNGKLFGVAGGKWGIVDAPGSDLPSVSASDNGKVLQVASGAWGAVKTRLDVSFTVSVDAGTGTLSVSANGTTFADIVAAFAAQQDIIAWIVLPDGAIMTTRSFTLDNVANPTSIAFGVTADFAGDNDAYAPIYYQINMTAESIGVRQEPLTVATV